AGKTTLAERLLYFSRTIPEMGEVEDGMATMDYLQEEQKRGITIEAGIASYKWKNCRITFIDAPGHVDFGSEVDFSLTGCEGALLIISGKRGLESQTLDAWNKIGKAGINPIIFINKMDLPGLDYAHVLEDIKTKLCIKPFVLTLPVYARDSLVGVVDVLNKLALSHKSGNPRYLLKNEIPEKLKNSFEQSWSDLIDVATEQDPDLTSDYLSGKELSKKRLVEGMAKTLPSGKYLPVYIGSALTNIGIRQLMNGINFLVPAPNPRDKTGILARVLKTGRYSNYGKVHILKLQSPLDKGNRLIKEIFKIQANILHPSDRGKPGTIAAVKFKPEFEHLKPGSWIVAGEKIEVKPTEDNIYNPLLQTRIETVNAGDYQKVNAIARKLAESDPSVNLSIVQEAGNWLLSTVGEVQLEVFCERLIKESGCEINIGPPRIKFLETLRQPLKNLKNEAESGNARIEVELDLIPSADGKANEIENNSGFASSACQQIFKSVLNQICEQGVAGYGALTGLRIVVKSINATPQNLPPPLLYKCLMDCLSLNLKEESIEILEPVMKLQVTFPSEYCGSILADLSARGGSVERMESRGKNTTILLRIPLQRIFGYANLLRSLSKGQGTYFLSYDGHEKMSL
ncbi:GTP-binding protein, partial [Fibrobacterota bacterium]